MKKTQTKNAKLFRQNVLSSLKAERRRIKYEQPIENIVRCGVGGGRGRGGGGEKGEGGQATI